MATFAEKKKAEKDATVRTIHLSIDYHLMTLYEAMQSGNEKDIRAQKALLRYMADELRKLEVPFRSPRIL